MKSAGGKRYTVFNATAIWMIFVCCWFMLNLHVRSSEILTTRRISTISERTLNNLILYGVMIGSYFVIVLPAIIFEARVARKHKEALLEMVNEGSSLSVDEFYEFSEQQLNEIEFTGVYVLHNETKNMNYVGQSIRVFHRIKQHFSGYGNRDVYADYKYGDEFSIRVIRLVDSGFTSINDLEREKIHACDAYTNGYNTTRGKRR